MVPFCMCFVSRQLLHDDMQQVSRIKVLCHLDTFIHGRHKMMNLIKKIPEQWPMQTEGAKIFNLEEVITQPTLGVVAVSIRQIQVDTSGI
jgi:hypothetical protein